MKKLSACAAVLLMPSMAWASPPDARIAAYLVNPVIDAGAGYGNSGTGLGVRGWGLLNPNWSIHGEFESTEMEDAEVTVQSLRLGTGFVGAISKQVSWMLNGEYVDFGSDLDQDGFGVHAGLVLDTDSALSYAATLGYLSTDDTDGLEAGASVHYAFSPRWGAVLDYRNYMGNADPSGDFELSEVRLGGTFSFD